MTNPDALRFARLKDIVVAALPLDPVARAEYLDRACAGDAALRSDVETLLRQDGRTDALVDPTAMAEMVVEVGGPPPASVPGRIGPYRILEVLGEGGMGVVFRAEQTAPLRREVALKLISRAVHSPEQRARFDQERQVLARMEHPNIARVLDAGATEDGRPYFVMELVRGVPITHYCRDQRLTLPARLRLFVEVCRAVQHAHRKGVIHRDLKPSNLLVTEEGGRAMPRIIDFGIAKDFDEDATASGLTLTGHVIGTLDYMSPEQASGGGAAVDTRSDVYSLGMILHELVTGALPYDLRGKSTLEALETIRRAEPGARLRTASGERVDADLAIVIGKALEKSPDRRYGGVGELADELERVLAGAPIAARAPTATYQLRKLVSRHRVPFAFAGLLLVLSVAFAVVLSFRLAAEQRERQRAERALARATRISDFLHDMLASVDASISGPDVRVRDVLDAAVVEARSALAGDPETQAAVLATLGNAFIALGLYEPGERQLREALALRESRLGRDHPEVAASLGDLANAIWLREQDRASQGMADSLARAALGIRSRTLGGESPAVAASLEQIAQIRLFQGRAAAAESLLQRAVAIRRGAEGDSAAALSATLAALARARLDLGRRREAEQDLRRALAIARRAHPGDHPEVAEAERQLAGLLIGGARRAEAESLGRDALAMNRRLWGQDHPRVSASLAELGTYHSAWGRWHEADSLLREALVIRERRYGEGNVATAEILNHLARNLALQGDLAGAERLQERAVAICRVRLGPGAPLAQSLDNLAELYARQARDRDAVRTYGEALSVMDSAHSGPSPMRARIQGHLGTFHMLRGRFAQAEPLQRAALEFWRQRHGPRHHEVGVVLQQLAYIRHGLDDLEGADRMYREALDIFRQTEHGGPPTIPHLRTLVNLGNCLHQRGRSAEALDLLERAARAPGPAREARHELRREIVAALGTVLVDLGRAGEAEPLLREALELCRLHLPANAGAVKLTENALAAALAATGQQEEAEALFARSSPAAWTRPDIPPAARELARRRALAAQPRTQRT